ncbi:MAG: hypothetical protein NTX86_00720 [Candidatus Dependentiae bacterium]|nr:hypothetical protein [Candidatus Dependentiae bacterium]
MEFRLSDCARLPGQIVFFIISAALLGYLLYKPASSFNPIGKSSFVIPLTPEITKKWGKEPVHVKTGFMIHQFINFDVIKNDFLITAIVWFEYDPTKISLETLGKFSFTKGDITQKSDPVVTKISDNLSFAKYHLRVQFNTIFDYTMFPLNDHIITLNLTNTSVSADDVIFDMSPVDFVVPEYVTVSGWNFVKHEAKSGFTEYMISHENKTTKEPKIVLSVGIQKKDIRQLVLMLLPILLLFYFCVFMLSIEEFSLKIQNILMIVTAYMAYNVVIQAMAPNVGYFMLIDYLVLFFLLVMFIIFVALMLGELPEETLAKSTYDSIKGGTVIAVYALVVGVVFYLTHYLV